MRGDFFDTNILVYAASAEDLRYQRAEALLASGGTISVQVMNEFVNVARRKMGLDWTSIRHFLGGVRDLSDVLPLDAAIHDQGLRLAERLKIDVYDAMIVSAALAGGCATLFTEDLHHGLVVDDRLTILNPFLAI